MCDDYTGYKASFAPGVTEAGCMAHALRKIIDLREANKSTIAATASSSSGSTGTARAIDYSLNRCAGRAGSTATS